MIIFKESFITMSELIENIENSESTPQLTINHPFLNPYHSLFDDKNIMLGELDPPLNNSPDSNNYLTTKISKPETFLSFYVDGIKLFKIVLKNLNGKIVHKGFECIRFESVNKKNAITGEDEKILVMRDPSLNSDLTLLHSSAGYSVKDLAILVENSDEINPEPLYHGTLDIRDEIYKKSLERTHLFQLDHSARESFIKGKQVVSMNDHELAAKIMRQIFEENICDYSALCGNYLISNNNIKVNLFFGSNELCYKDGYIEKTMVLKSNVIVELTPDGITLCQKKQQSLSAY